MGLNCASVFLTLAGDHTFCFYPKLPLTFSVFLEIPVCRQLSFSLRMGTALKRPQYSAVNEQQCYAIFAIDYMEVNMEYMPSDRADVKNTSGEGRAERFAGDTVGR